MTPSAPRTVIEGGLIVGFDGTEHRLLRDGALVYEADRIVHVGRAYAGPRDRAIDARGKLVIPGQISGHAHVSAQEGGRLLIDGGRRDFFRSGFPNYLPTRGDGGTSFLRDADGRASLRFGLASLIRHGITTVVPFAPAGADAGATMVEEASAFGVRIYHAPVVLSGRYFFDDGGRLHRVLDEAASLRGLDATAAFIEKHNGAAGGRVRGIVTIDEFYNATPRLLRDARALATRLGVGLTMHFCEQVLEFLDTVRATGKTPAAVLRDEGVLARDVLLAHSVYVAGHRASAYPHGGDLEILAASGASVVHAPAGFARRGISLESFDRYRAAGVNMVMGTDVYPLDMLAEMRTAALACKLFEQNHEAAPAMAIFNASNLGGARALGRDDLGRLAPGAKADIVLLDWDNLHIGPFTDPIRALIYQGSPDMVHTVICDGRVLMEDKRLLVCEEHEVLAAARRSADRVWAGFDGYHWAGRGIDEEFPPAIRPWPDA
ncbi:MAG: amidohydrolase family protein [Candidatus Rokubacteria bacterium]|nr:amidohydrolase family protein [Candidatus Rokubacteria bacterium]